MPGDADQALTDKSRMHSAAEPPALAPAGLADIAWHALPVEKTFAALDELRGR